MNSSRRHFLTHAAAVSTGFAGLDHFLQASSDSKHPTSPYGPLKADTEGYIDLPNGFQYRIISKMGQPMADGFKVPGQPDGMAAFPGEDGRVVLVRNHEMGHQHSEKGPFQDNSKLPAEIDRDLVYDPGDGYPPFVGGTTNVIYEPESGKVEKEFLSLLGTDRNCAGGPTPWGTWVTCEEPEFLVAAPGSQNHGSCVEVPASATGLANPKVIPALGRFRHEAIAVHPKTGIVYETEDRGDGLIYRLIPAVPGQLEKGGKLQALALAGKKAVDTAANFPLRKRLPVRWVDLEDIESADDTLRFQGFDRGAARFARSEGMWYASESQTGEESIYWCCTSGGANRQGQIFRYFPSPAEGTEAEQQQPGEMELYLEPNDSKLLQNGDNITIAPWGDLIICEDTKGSNAIRGVTPNGQFYTLARNVKNGSEFAGACFSPDGQTLFVNIQTPGDTLAITGPWKQRSS